MFSIDRCAPHTGDVCLFVSGTVTLSGGNYLNASSDQVKVVAVASSCADAGIPLHNIQAAEGSISSTKWRVSNAGMMSWRPGVSTVKMYSDRDCTQRVATTGGSAVCSGDTPYGGGSCANGFDDSTGNSWRPQDGYCCSSRCSPFYMVGTAWIGYEFSSPVTVRCITAQGNLGWGGVTTTSMTLLLECCGAGDMAGWSRDGCLC